MKHRYPLRWITFVAAASFCLTVSVRAAAQPAPEDRRVTVNIRDIPLRDALDSLLSGTGLQYVVDPNVPPVLLTLRLENVPLQQALRLLVQTARIQAPRLTLSRDGDVFLFRLREAPSAEPSGDPALDPTAPPESPEPEALQRRVTLNLREVHLRDAFEQLLAGTGLHAIVSPEVPHITLTANLRDVTLQQAIRVLIQTARSQAPRLTLTREENVFLIRLREAPQEPEALQRRVTLNMREVPLRDAIEQLLSGTGLQYIVSPEIPHVTITANLRDVTLQQALRVLVRTARQQVPGLTLEQEGNVYLIRLLETPSGPPAGRPEGQAALQLTASVTAVGPDRRPLQLRSMSRGVSGSSLRIDERSVFGDQEARLQVTLLPHVEADGSILVETEWEVSVPVGARDGRPSQVVKRHTASTRLQPGVAQVVAESDLEPTGGLGKLRLWLRAEPPR